MVAAVVFEVVFEIVLLVVAVAGVDRIDEGGEVAEDDHREAGGSKAQSLRTTSRMYCLASRTAASRLSLTDGSTGFDLRCSEAKTELCCEGGSAAIVRMDAKDVFDRVGMSIKFPVTGPCRHSRQSLKGHGASEPAHTERDTGRSYTNRECCEESWSQ